MTENSLWCGSRERLTAAIMADAQVADRSRVEAMAVRIETIHPTLRDAVVKFLECGQVDDRLEVMGYSIKRIQTEQHIGVLGALSCLHGLIVHPDQTIRNMKGPKDRIVFADSPRKGANSCR